MIMFEWSCQKFQWVSFDFNLFVRDVYITFMYTEIALISIDLINLLIRNLYWEVIQEQ